MNVNVHTENKFWNLGLCRIIGSMPAEKCVQILQDKLAGFGLSFNDNVSITTDGAAVMKKVGKILNINQQLCFAHAIHLGVVKVLYTKKIANKY